MKTVSYVRTGLVVAFSLTVGCAAPTFSLRPPPTLPSTGGMQPPQPPVAEQEKTQHEAANVQLETHKTRAIPALQQKLVGLIPLAATSPDVSGKFEDELFVRLVDQGVTRIVPGAALASVHGEVAQPDPGVKGSSIKLTAALSSLALVTRASRADFLVYGELKAGEAHEVREVGYSMDPAALDAYQRSYNAFAGALNTDAKRLNSTCLGAMSSFNSEMAQFTKAGGQVGKEEAGLAAADAERVYRAFNDDCAARKGSLKKLYESVPSPTALQQATGQKRGQVKMSYTLVTAMISIRDSATDETFWIGRFEAKAPSLDEGILMIAERVAAELGGRTLTPPAAESVAPLAAPAAPVATPVPVAVPAP
jgi:hypothetical protein